jgi:hypothetical protein
MKARRACERATGCGRRPHACTGPGGGPVGRWGQRVGRGGNAERRAPPAGLQVGAKGQALVERKGGPEQGARHGKGGCTHLCKGRAEVRSAHRPRREWGG